MKLNLLIAGLAMVLALAAPLTAAEVLIPDHNSPATDVVALNALTTGVSEVTTNPPAPAPGFVQTPYLQSLSPTSMAVLWQTREPAYGWVEFGPTPALGAKQDASVHGLRTANVTEHRVVLDGLRPGTNYWYRVAFKPIRKFQAYKVEFGPEQGSEPVAFQTLPGPRQPVTTVIFNDLHNDTMLFQQLRRVADETRFDFSVFNGDCFADPAAAQPVLTTLATYTKGVQADHRPAFFLRGNHETRGAYARQLPALLAWPGDQPYFAFSAGSVRFVLLDLGEDKPDDHSEYSGLIDFARFRREETEWLKHEVASREYRKATWRVLVHHIPLYWGQSAAALTNRPAWQQSWPGLLKQADLAISGHTHVRAFYPARTVGNPYPVVIGGGPKTNTATVMILEADARRLKLRVLDLNGKEVFPTFEKKR
jgi:hypothetical protein